MRSCWRLAERMQPRTWRKRNDLERRKRSPTLPTDGEAEQNMPLRPILTYLATNRRLKAELPFSIPLIRPFI